MLAEKYAILSAYNNSFLNDIGHGYNREFTKNGAIFIDYEELYTRYGRQKAEEVIHRIIEQNSIEVLIYHCEANAFHFSLEFFRLLQEKVFVVMMLGDTEHYFAERDVYYAQCMDLVIVYDCMSRYRFKQYGIDAISFYSSYDKGRYFKIDGMEETIDISFIGDIACKMYRNEYIGYITKTGLTVEVFGTGSRNGQVTLERMVQIFNKTKINLNFADISLKNAIKKELNINGKIRQMKGRMAEVTLCRGFVLGEYVPGIEEVFEPDKEIIIFHSKEEMVEKIKYYLGHDDKRHAIAEKGYIRALKDYEISTAIPRLISRIEDFRKVNAKRFPEIYVDSRFIRNYTTFRVEMIVKFLRLRKWKQLCEELLVILKNRRLDIVKALGVFLFGMFPLLKKIYLLGQDKRHAR